MRGPRSPTYGIALGRRTPTTSDRRQGCASSPRPRRGEELLRQLPESVRALRTKLHSPVGLNFGGETPENIALSIVAEIQAVLNCRSAESLHERNAPIHEPEQTPWG